MDERTVGMVDLSEKELFDNDIEVAFSVDADISEFKKIVKEQQRYIKSLVEENEKMREKILDDILG